LDRLRVFSIPTSRLTIRRRFLVLFALWALLLKSFLLDFARQRGITLETLPPGFCGGFPSIFFLVALSFRFAMDRALLPPLRLSRSNPWLAQRIDDVSTELLDPLGNIGGSQISKSQFLPIDILPSENYLQHFVLSPLLFIIKPGNADIENWKNEILPTEGLFSLKKEIEFVMAMGTAHGARSHNWNKKRRFGDRLRDFICPQAAVRYRCCVLPQTDIAP
jgi:hypothetical protein